MLPASTDRGREKRRTSSAVWVVELLAIVTLGARLGLGGVEPVEALIASNRSRTPAVR